MALEPPRLTAIWESSHALEVRWWDVAGVLVVFWLPGATIWMILGWRSYREFVVQRRLDQKEAEAIAAEGFPPPDPPTTDSLPADSANLEAPPTEEPP